MARWKCQYTACPVFQDRVEPLHDTIFKTGFDTRRLRRLPQQQKFSCQGVVTNAQAAEIQTAGKTISTPLHAVYACWTFFLQELGNFFTQNVKDSEINKTFLWKGKLNRRA